VEDLKNMLLRTEVEAKRQTIFKDTNKMYKAIAIAVILKIKIIMIFRKLIQNSRLMLKKYSKNMHAIVCCD
jgi:hypothetical protein